MIGKRGVLTLFLAISFVVSILLGFQDKLARNNASTLCKSATSGQIDFCARNGGMNH